MTELFHKKYTLYKSAGYLTGFWQWPEGFSLIIPAPLPLPTRIHCNLGRGDLVLTAGQVRPYMFWGGSVCIGNEAQVIGFWKGLQHRRIPSYWVENIERCPHKIGKSILKDVKRWARDCGEVSFQKVTHPYPFWKEWALGTGLTGCQLRWIDEEKPLALSWQICAYKYVCMWESPPRR